MPPTPIPQHCSPSVGEPKAGLAFLCWPRVIKLGSLFMRRNRGSSTASPSARNFPRHQPFLNVFQINCQGRDFFPRAEVVHSLGISWLSHPRAHLSSCHNSGFLHHGVTRGWAALLGLPSSPEICLGSLAPCENPPPHLPALQTSPCHRGTQMAFHAGIVYESI